MRKEFRGTYAKLDRSDRGLVELRDLLQAHIDRPDVVAGTVEYTPQAPVAADLLSRVVSPPLPTTVQVVIGEIAYNLRSALDHVAYQLVQANGGRPKDGPGGTQFPIKDGDAGKRVQVRTDVGGVSGAALRIIRSAQPDVTPFRYGDALGVLSHVNNVDKHREPARARRLVTGWTTWREGMGRPALPWRSDVLVGERSIDQVEIRLDPAVVRPGGGGMAFYSIELEVGSDRWAPLYGTLEQVAWQVRRLVGDLVATVP